MLILADDFTGACDAAGAFGSTQTTVVVTRVPSEWPPDAEVLAVDLDVRERSPAEADAASEAATRLLGAEARVFVKIDSTLRGPITGLVGGALRGSGRSLAIVAPAFPEQGRQVVDGHLVVNGERGSRVDSVLPSVKHTVVDAATSQELRALALTTEAHPEWLLVGSAGLARQLAPSSVPWAPVARDTGPVVVAAGSPTRVTRQQLERVSGLRDVVILATPATDARDAGEAAERLADDVRAWARSHTPRAAVLTGGATARAVIHRLGVRHLRVRGELQPGVPFGTLEDGVWHGLTVVTKAGGFGAPETLLDVVHALGVSSASA